MSHRNASSENAPSENAPSLFDEQESLIERIVEKFENEWKSAQLERLAEAVQSAPAEVAPGLLAELVETDIELRSKQQLRLQDYLDRFPELRQLEESLAALVLTDYRLRSKPPARPKLGSYLQQFPKLRARLVELATADETVNQDDTSVSNETVNTINEDACNTGDLPATPRRYQIIEELDSGGRGSIYLARDKEVDRLVCVKKIHEQLAGDERSKRRFLNEANITSKVEHPGVVPIYGIGSNENGEPFYSMRYIQGVSLQQKIRGLYQASAGIQPGRLEQRELLGRFQDICHVIEYAHSRGIIHRDLKPANVMVGDFGETFVVDWGLAKELPSDRVDDEPQERATSEASLHDTATLTAEATQVGDLLGSPAYMSPEQAAGRPADQRTDVYGLGAILYEVIAGRPPFSGAAVTRVIEDVSNGRMTPPRQVNPQAPKPLQAICLRAMSRDRSDRYSSVAELSRDIDHFLADQPVEAYRDSMMDRINRFARNHRRSVLAAACGLLLMTVASLVGAAAINNAKRSIADSEARQERVLSLVVELFDVPNANASARDVLDNAVGVAERSLGDDRLTKAKFFTKIGVAYQKLGVHVEALKLFDEARSILVQELGEAHEETQEVEAHLASTMLAVDHPKEALPIFERLYESALVTYGNEDPRVLIALNGIGRANDMLGNTKVAVDILEDAIQTADRVLAEDSYLKMKIRNNLSLAYRKDGNLERANALAKENLAAREAVFGEDHLNTATAAYSLALSLTNQERFEEAEPLYRRALKTQTDLLPPDSHELIKTRNALALNQAQAGDFESAIPEFQTVIAQLTELNGPEYRYTRMAKSNLAHTYEVAEDFDESAEGFRAVIADVIDEIEQQPIRVIYDDAVSSLPRVLTRSQQPQAAVEFVQEHLPRFDHDNANRAELLLYAGDALVTLAKPEAALEYLLPIITTQTSNKKGRLAYAHSCAAECYLQLGQLETAKQHLQQASQQFDGLNLIVERRYFLEEHNRRRVLLENARTPDEGTDSEREANREL